MAKNNNLIELKYHFWFQKGEEKHNQNQGFGSTT